MTTLNKQYEAALKKIGTVNLLNLPEEIKEALKEVTDIETKVKMLEAIAKVIK